MLETSSDKHFKARLTALMDVGYAYVVRCSVDFAWLQ